MQLIPAIDLKDGCCVRLFQGDFNRKTVYNDDPVEVARNFAGMGMSSLHLVDLDGARAGIQRNHDRVREILAATDMSVQLGGGIRNADSIRQWLDCGVTRCVIGSIAVLDAAKVRTWFAEFGPPSIVVALDIRLGDDGTPMLATHGWTKTTDRSLWHCIDDYIESGLTQVLCTDISRDGALSGPNLELYAELHQRYPALQIQASGGVRHAEDLQDLRSTGAHAAIAGRALLDGRITQAEVRSFQRNE